MRDAVPPISKPVRVVATVLEDVLSSATVLPVEVGT